jgi:hypothetical protein
VLAGQAMPESVVAATTISWLAVYGLVFGTLAIRLAIEVYPSLPAFAALSLSALFYLTAGLITLDMLPQPGPLVASVMDSLVVLVAHVSLVAALALYTRHVVLDAGGRLKVHIDPDKRKGTKPKPKAKLKVVKEEKPEKQADDKPAEKRVAAAASKPAAATSEKPKAGDGPKFGAGPLASKVSASVSKPATTNYDDDDDEEDDEDGQRLSRAERRKLKKMSRRDDQRRAA